VLLDTRRHTNIWIFFLTRNVTGIQPRLASHTVRRSEVCDSFIYNIVLVHSQPSSTHTMPKMYVSLFDFWTTVRRAISVMSSWHFHKKENNRTTKCRITRTLIYVFVHKKFHRKYWFAVCLACAPSRPAAPRRSFPSSKSATSTSYLLSKINTS